LSRREPHTCHLEYDNPPSWKIPGKRQKMTGNTIAVMKNGDKEKQKDNIRNIRNKIERGKKYEIR
jgi:hypothetical protein